MLCFYTRWGQRVLAGTGLLASLASPAAAQTAPADTTHLRYEEELGPAAGLPPVPRQARDQWKLALNNFIVNGYAFSQTKDVPGYYTRYGLHLAYERRLGRAWSGQAELSPAIIHYRAEGAAGPPVAGAQLRAQVAGRYYYNLERRLLRGRRTAGFAANYFSLALGLGLSEGPSETPFHLLVDGTGPATDAALLYGLQRRLGRYGFVDLNAGLSAALRAGCAQQLAPVVSLRIGLALSATPAGAGAPSVAPPGEVTSLLPRFFVGLQLGDARYHTHYSRANPYPASYQETVNGYEKYVIYALYGPNYNGDAVGWQTYDNDHSLYLYGGYYLTPRLAVQLGVQYGASTQPFGLGAAGVRKGPEDWHVLQNRDFGLYVLATPVQVRYALTRTFQRRLQVEVVGGLTPVWSGVHFREYETDGYATTEQVKVEFKRTALGLTANLGGALSYSLDRRRRLQATVDYGLQQDLHHVLNDPEPWATYAKVGLRYRFGYR